MSAVPTSPICALSFREVDATVRRLVTDVEAATRAAVGQEGADVGVFAAEESAVTSAMTKLAEACTWTTPEGRLVAYMVLQRLVVFVLGAPRWHAQRVGFSLEFAAPHTLADTEWLAFEWYGSLPPDTLVGSRPLRPLMIEALDDHQYTFMDKLAWFSGFRPNQVFLGKTLMGWALERAKCEIKHGSASACLDDLMALIRVLRHCARGFRPDELGTDPDSKLCIPTVLGIFFCQVPVRSQLALLHLLVDAGAAVHWPHAGFVLCEVMERGEVAVCKMESLEEYLRSPKSEVVLESLEVEDLLHKIGMRTSEQ